MMIFHLFMTIYRYLYGTLNKQHASSTHQVSTPGDLQKAMLVMLPNQWVLVTPAIKTYPLVN